jgi:hypothetical protein
VPSKSPHKEKKRAQIRSSELNSHTKDCGFESRLIQNTRWTWVKAMLGSIPTPNSVSFMEKKKNIGSHMGQTDKKFKKTKKT